VSGRMDLSIGSETHAVSAGGSWCIPGDMEHGAVAREDSVAIEVFLPGPGGLSMLVGSFARCYYAGFPV